MKESIKITCALILASVMAGCITSRSPDFVGYQLQLNNGKAKKSIAYSFLRSGNASVGKEFNPTTTMPPASGAWVVAQPEATALYQFHSVFDPVATAINPTVDRTGGSCDIMLEIHQQSAFNPLVGFPAFLSGFTFTCLPCWGDDVYHLNVTAKNKEGVKREYTISRSVSTTLWLPFILAAPFAETPIVAREKITLENWKELRCKMEDDGFFDNTTTAQIQSETSNNAAQNFEKLKKLKDQGVITQEEFTQAVNRIK